jgi:hypothetical protein
LQIAKARAVIGIFVTPIANNRTQKNGVFAAPFRAYAEFTHFLEEFYERKNNQNEKNEHAFYGDGREKRCVFDT